MKSTGKRGEFRTNIEGWELKLHFHYSSIKHNLNKNYKVSSHAVFKEPNLGVYAIELLYDDNKEAKIVIDYMVGKPANPKIKFKENLSGETVNNIINEVYNYVLTGLY